MTTCYKCSDAGNHVAHFSGGTIRPVCGDHLAEHLVRADANEAVRQAAEYRERALRAALDDDAAAARAAASFRSADDRYRAAVQRRRSL